MKQQYAWCLRLWIGLAGLLPCVGYTHGTIKELRFVENRGQWEDPVRYRVQMPAGYMYLESNRISCLLLDAATLRNSHPLPQEDDVVKAHAWRMHFVDAQAQAPQGEQVLAYHENYFRGDDPDRWAAGVRSFRSVKYAEVWPGIGMRWLAQGSSLKYDIHLSPGADCQQIRFRYEGLEKIYLKDGTLRLRTSLDEITEAIPEAWQQINGHKIPVACEYVLLDDSTVGFRFPEGYDPRYRLVIDPVLIFSTYTGSFADNWGMTATYDASGCLYSGGVVNGVGYPTTVGAIQAFFAGGRSMSLITYSLTYECDMSIIKYSPDGTTALYSTYIGGRNNDQPISLIVNDQDELFIYGITRSDNFPTTAGAFQRNLAGPFTFTAAGDIDMVVLRLNASGTSLLGSTYVGGSNHDGNNMYDPNPNNSNSLNINPLYHFYADDTRGEIQLDDAGRIYIIGSSQSPNFPSTAGSFKPNLSGIQDAIVLCLSGDLTNLFWASFFGGNGFDSGYSIKLDSQSNIYFVGGTTSNNLPTSPNAWRVTFQSANANLPDGYTACLSNDGRNLLHATYVGTAAYDQVYFLDFDLAGDVFVVGQTQGDYPAFGTIYHVPNGKQFITKLKPDLSDAKYSMRFGTGNLALMRSDITMTAFLVDKCDNIYVSGWGSPNLTVFRTPGTASGSTFGLPVTPDAYQPITNGSDFYLMVLHPDAAGLRYATFFGGNLSNDHVDGGTSRFDKNGIIYHSSCASCFNPVFNIDPINDFPTTPGAFSRTDNSFNCNNGSFKFDFELLNFASASYSFDTITTEGCAPYRVEFTNRSSGAIGYIWDFGDGSPINTETNPVHIYTEPGRYRVRLIAVNNGKCERNDTIFQIVDVFQRTQAEFDLSQPVCSNSIQLVNNTRQGTTWEWDFGDGVQSDEAQPGQHSYLAAGEYAVRLVVNPGTLCSDTLERTVNIPLLPDARFRASPDPCLPRAFLSAERSGPQTFRWFIEGVEGGSNPFFEFNFGRAGVFQVELEAQSPEGCTDRQVQWIEVVDAPSLGGRVESDHTVCRGQASRVLQLVDNIGTVDRWEFSKDGGTTWVSMGKAGQTSLTSGRLTVETWFRAIVQRENCPTDASRPARVAVSDALQTGVLSGAQTVCADTLSTELELLDFTGSIVRWEQSVDAGETWNTIANTSPIYLASEIRQSTWFRVLLFEPLCGTTYSPTARIELLGTVAGGRVLGAQTLCRGQASGLMHLVDHQGEVLRWEFSKDDRRTWFSMGKRELTALGSGRLTVSTWFRAVVGRSGCPERPSEPVLIEVEDQQHAGVLLGGGSFCGPAPESVLQLVGYRGDILFWEQSPDGTNWIAIDHQAADYRPGTLEHSMWYRVVLGSVRCGLIRSAEAVYQIGEIAKGGRVVSDHTVCRGQASELLQLMDHAGQIKRWEFSKDNGQSWFSMGKAGQKQLKSGRLTVDTWFRAVVETDFCKPVHSEPVRVEVDSGNNNGEVLGGGRVCIGSPYPEMRYSLDHVPILRWETSVDRGASWQAIAFNQPVYRPGGTVQDERLFRVIRSDSRCAGGASAAARIESILPVSSGQLVSVRNTVCAGQIADALELQGAGGPVIRWEKRNLLAVSWQPIPEQTNRLNPGVMNQSTEFRAVIASDPCPPLVSPSLQLHVVQVPSAGQLRVSSSRLCHGVGLVSIELSDTQADVVAWEVRAEATDLVQRLEIPTSRLELNNLNQTSFIRAQLNSQGCGQVFTPESRIEVNPVLDLQVSGEGLCGGLNRIQARASGGLAPFTYHLRPALLPSNTSGLFENLPAGQYSVEVRDAAGCSRQQAINLDQLVAPPGQVRVEIRTATSALVQWDPIPGNRVQYEVRYRLVGESSWITLPPTLQNFILIHGLQAGGFYELEVAALCPRPDGNDSGFDRIPAPDRPRFATPNTGTCALQPPSVPGGVYVSQITDRSARVHWSPHQDMQSHQGYIVSFGLASINPNNWPQFVVCHRDTYFTIMGLSPNRLYGARVRANCTNCTTALQSTDRRSNWSHIVNFETLSQRKSNEVGLDSEIRLYPNPTRGGFTLETPCIIEDAQLEIWSIQGRRVWMGWGSYTEHGLYVEPHLSAGLYRVRFRYCNGEAHLPLVIY